MKFTKRDIEYLRQTLSRHEGNIDNPEWVRAFEFYGKHREALSMSCFPCYERVLGYVVESFGGGK